MFARIQSLVTGKAASNLYQGTRLAEADFGTGFPNTSSQSISTSLAYAKGFHSDSMGMGLFFRTCLPSTTRA